MLTYNYNDSLCHFGIPGQKWGIRRYQNEDGTLTEEGRQRYGYEDGDSSNDRGYDSKSARSVDKYESGKDIREISDEALAKRKEAIKQLHRQARVNAIISGVAGVSMIAIGHRMKNSYGGQIIGRALQSLGIGYTLGTGLGSILETGANRFANKAIRTEEERRRTGIKS